MDQNIEIGVYQLKNEQMYELIKTHNLTINDEKNIENALAEFSEYSIIRYYKSKELLRVFLTEIYILRFYSDFTPKDIGEAYEKNVRTIQKLLKKVCWEMDSKEAQRRATLKRDYEVINLKSRETRLKSIASSNIEDYIRHNLYLKLKKSFPSDDVIVGINSINFADTFELDIPIIIFRNDDIRKFAIEIDGEHHQKEIVETRDKRKKELLYKKGYCVYSVPLKQTHQSLVDSKVDEIVSFISKKIY